MNKNVELVSQTIHFLSNEIKPTRSYLHINALNKAADFIYEQMNLYSKDCSQQIYEIDNTKYKNLICSFNATKGKRIIIGAHYDVYKDTPGADDNASGIAGVILLAKLLSESKVFPDYRIDLVAYTLEEKPFFHTERMGSYVHAKSLRDQRIEVEFAIILEMIGYFSNKKGSQKYPSLLLKLLYPSRGDFIALAGRINEYKLLRKLKRSKITDLKLVSIIAPKKGLGIDQSDNNSYWENGIKSVMITDTAYFRNPHYHKLTDTLDTLDLNKISLVVDLIYKFIINYD